MGLLTEYKWFFSIARIWIRLPGQFHEQFRVRLLRIMTTSSVLRTMATKSLIVRAIPCSGQWQRFGMSQMTSRSIDLNPSSLALCSARQTPRFLSSKEYSANASNIGDPISSSPESQAVNVARWKQSRASDQVDTRSTQSPISPNRRAHTSEAQEDEEEGSLNDHIKNDPNASPEAKRQSVDKTGKKPLEPEDSWFGYCT